MELRLEMSVHYDCCYFFFWLTQVSVLCKKYMRYLTYMQCSDTEGTVMNSLAQINEYLPVSFSLKDVNSVVIPCSTKFLRVLGFAIFAGFFSISKNKFPQNKITANFFPQKFTLR